MKPAKVVPAQCRGFQAGSMSFTYTEDKAILYALGVGFSTDPLNQAELAFTFELSDNFKVAPTFGVVLCDSGYLFNVLTTCPGLPDFNPMMLLHGEQRVDIYKPFAPSGTVKMQGEIVDVADKGKGALLTMKLAIADEGGAKLCDCFYKFFIRGLGGFGDKGVLTDTIPAMPERQPDKVVVERTLPSQAILYRLSGDKNPLHISKDMAEMGGFDKPILHGLCTYGVGAKAVLREFCHYDVSQFKSIYVPSI